MKNIFAVFVLFFASTCGVFAQESENKDPLVLAKNELISLTKVIEINNERAIIINDLLIYKHEMALKYPERKEEVATTIEHKLKGVLTAEDFSKVKKDKVLFQDLIY